MAQTLSQKYRPKNWDELVGQNHIKITLENEIKEGKLAHAYLFCGPRGIGKTTVARLLAKSINCQKPTKGYDPCNKCGSCKDILENRALDIMEIDAASNTGVDNVRENIINNARVAPTGLKYKVFIIDEVHMLSISAFNALLKTLEEPPANTIFILATTEVHKVPATIISRCQRFDFKRAAIDDVVDRLGKISTAEGLKASREILEKVARRSEGYLRDAESLLGQIASLTDKEITMEMVDLVIPRSDLGLMVDFFVALIDKDLSTSLGVINKLSEEGVDFSEFNKEFIEFSRKLLLYKVGLQTEVLTYFDFDKDTRKKLVGKLDHVTVLRLKQIVELFIVKGQEIKYSALPQLPLELAAVELSESNDDQEDKTGGTPTGGRMDSMKEAYNKTTANKPTVKKPITKATEALRCEASTEVVKKKWKEIIKKLKKRNHSLALTLKIGQLVKCEDGVLTIGFKYKFYQDRLQDHKNKVLVEEVLSEVLNSQIVCETMVGENFMPEVIIDKSDNLEEVPDKDGDELMDLAIKTLGGKAV